MSIEINDLILQNILKNSRPYEEGLYEDLQDPEEAQAYLEAGFEGYEEDGDMATLLLIVRDIINARGGIDQLAQKTDIDRQSLTATLDGDVTPSLEFLLKILSGLGFRIRLERQGGEVSLSPSQVD
ncbi:putative addiction module antidote protein [Candidatus Poribacteria bacterium]|nr:putative addiction module antidote protein [Candidatus Poribacteria bacterium]